MKFEDLVNTYISDMYATAVRLTGSPDVAEDLVHDLFVNLQTKGFGTDHVKNPRAWLAAILYRQFVDWWRRETRSPVKLFSSRKQGATEQFLDEVPSEQPGPLQQMESADQTRVLLHALNRLNEEQRRIIIMHDIEGFTLPELQQMMTLPLGTLKSRLHRAREKLQNLLTNNSLLIDELTYRRFGVRS